MLRLRKNLYYFLIILFLLLIIFITIEFYIGHSTVYRINNIQITPCELRRFNKNRPYLIHKLYEKHIFPINVYIEANNSPLINRVAQINRLVPNVLNEFNTKLNFNFFVFQKCLLKYPNKLIIRENPPDCTRLTRKHAAHSFYPPIRKICLNPTLTFSDKALFLIFIHEFQHTLGFKHRPTDYCRKNEMTNITEGTDPNSDGLTDCDIRYIAIAYNLFNQ
ncbi:mp-nase-like protein [Glossina pallidipes salivary gland hypertrophy virus]|uniref:Mp-nase-like protein n=1 Tax=Glossina hytrovirus (isolate Glossina pallidipes/Ethiopia/Seibersdorf/-) TaxID=379529 RepID=A0A0Y0KBL2_GHVS|nr:mp-nase-like protein [Glossina pallidipes salivary gland hypertrophy virus]